MRYLFYFKHINDNLDRFSNTSSFNRHCTTMDTNLEIFNCRNQRKFCRESKVIFSKTLQYFQNEFLQLSKEGQEYQKTRFFFHQQKILNLPQNLRYMIK